MEIQKKTDLLFSQLNINKYGNNIKNKSHAVFFLCNRLM